LIKALSFHKLAYKKRSQEFIEVTERIKIHEEKLSGLDNEQLAK
jgi:hypothetical protein